MAAWLWLAIQPGWLTAQDSAAGAASDSAPATAERDDERAQRQRARRQSQAGDRQGAQGCSAPFVSDSGHLPAGLHLPSSYTVLANRAFNDRREGDWGLTESRLFRVAEDPTAPVSPPCVGVASYPQGFAAGRGPMNTWVDIPEGYSRLYVAIWVKMSRNWFGNQSSVNKILFLWVHRDPVVILSAQGSGRRPLTAEVLLQGITGGARNLAPTRGRGGEIRRGEWVRWEVLLEAGEEGRGGTLRWWINGSQVATYEHIPYARSGQGNSWQRVSWNPTYGGSGNAVPKQQSMLMDHMIVAVAR